LHGRTTHNSPLLLATQLHIVSVVERSLQGCAPVTISGGECDRTFPVWSEGSLRPDSFYKVLVLGTLLVRPELLLWAPTMSALAAHCWTARLDCHQVSAALATRRRLLVQIPKSLRHTGQHSSDSNT